MSFCYYLQKHPFVLVHVILEEIGGSMAIKMQQAARPAIPPRFTSAAKLGLPLIKSTRHQQKHYSMLRQCRWCWTNIDLVSSHFWFKYS